MVVFPSWWFFFSFFFFRPSPSFPSYTGSCESADIKVLLFFVPPIHIHLLTHNLLLFKISLEQDLVDPSSITLLSLPLSLPLSPLRTCADDIIPHLARSEFFTTILIHRLHTHTHTHTNTHSLFQLASEVLDPKDPHTRTISRTTVFSWTLLFLNIAYHMDPCTIIHSDDDVIRRPYR